MATKTEDKKIYEPETYDETPLPEAVIWEEIVDKPTTLAELSPTDGATLAAAEIAIDGLGDLAYEDLVETLNIANLAITNAKIAVDAIQGDVIAANAITTVKISDNAIEAGKIAAGAVVAGKLAANSVVASNIQAGVITADKMNVSTLSAITANVGTLTSGAINGLTITGGTVRTASSGTRVQMDSGSNELQIYSGSTKRARGYDQGWDWYNSSGTLKGSIYVSSNDMLIAADLTSTGKLYYGVGSSGTHSFHVGTGASTIRMYIDDDEMWLGDADDFGFDVHLFGILNIYNGIEMDGDLDWGINPGNILLEDGIIHIDEGFFRLASMSGTTADARSDDLVNGNMYYRTDDGVIRVRLNGAWRTVTTT